MLQVSVKLLVTRISANCTSHDSYLIMCIPPRKNCLWLVNGRMHWNTLFIMCNVAPGSPHCSWSPNQLSSFVDSILVIACLIACQSQWHHKTFVRIWKQAWRIQKLVECPCFRFDANKFRIWVVGCDGWKGFDKTWIGVVIATRFLKKAKPYLISCIAIYSKVGKRCFEHRDFQKKHTWGFSPQAFCHKCGDCGHSATPQGLDVNKCKRTDKGTFAWQY